MNKQETDFDQRNKQKKHIERNNHKTIDIKTGEIYWFYQGMNIGHEQSKNNPFLRPCVILNNKLVAKKYLIAPLTTNSSHLREKWIFHDSTKYWLKPSAIMLDEVRLISEKRICKRIGSQKISHQTITHIYKQYIFFIQKLTPHYCGAVCLAWRLLSPNNNVRLLK